jgi:hypothetical protein
VVWEIRLVRSVALLIVWKGREASRERLLRMDRCALSSSKTFPLPARHSTSYTSIRYPRITEEG